MYSHIKEKSQQIQNLHGFTNLKRLLYLTIQGDLRPSSFEIRVPVFGIMQVFLSNGL